MTQDHDPVGPDKHGGMAWTEQRKELVRKLWAEGWSASEVAAQVGAVSRNAVIGVIYRNGWQRGQVVRVWTAERLDELKKLDIGRFTKEQIAGRIGVSIRQVYDGLGHRKRQVSERHARVGRPAHIFPLVLRDAPKPKPNLPPVGAKAVRFLDLLPNNCRWPLGAYDDPPEFFCGAEASGSYCPYHQDVACGRVSGGMTLPQPERSKRRVGSIIFTKRVA